MNILRWLSKFSLACMSTVSFGQTVDGGNLPMLCCFLSIIEFLSLPLVARPASYMSLLPCLHIHLQAAGQHAQQSFHPSARL